MSISWTMESLITPLLWPWKGERFIFTGSNSSIQAVPCGVNLTSCRSA